MNNYFIMEGYNINQNPTHHIDVGYTDESQDEVYLYAKKILENENLNTIVDVGCGSGYKLIKYFDKYNTVGIETEPCISFLNETYPDKIWINSGEPEKSFPKYKQNCDILICSDVIEHIVDPQKLINFLNTFDFKYLIISTPDRQILKDKIPGYGIESWVGPPKNPSHVREWEFNEFNSFLSQTFDVTEGKHGLKQQECMFFICKKKSKKKVVIISADFGNNSNFEFIIPEQVNCNFSYEILSFNDKNTRSRNLALHPRTKGKIPKMLQWMETEADYYIWLDSKFKIISQNFINDIIDQIKGYDLVLFNHPNRTSIKNECDFVINGMKNNDRYLLDRYIGEKMEEQVNEYLKDKTFVDNKLFSLGFFVYSKNLIKNRDYNIMTDWFFHNCYWSIQDQLSFPYLLHKHKTNYKVFEFNIFKNEYVKYG